MTRHASCNRSPAFMAGLAAVLACVAAVAQPYTVDWATIDGGGVQNCTGGAYELSGTLGQSDAASNSSMTGAEFELSDGFWTVTQVCYCLGDLNHDGRKDGADIQNFIACLLGGGDCPCADVDAVNGLTLADAEVLVNDLLTGDTCDN